MDNNKALKKMKECTELKGFAPSTQKNYMINIKMFARHFNLSLEELQPEDAQEFLYGLVSKKFSHSYLITVYALLQIFCDVDDFCILYEQHNHKLLYDTDEKIQKCRITKNTRLSLRSSAPST
jgi:hypothetical protein